MLIGNNDTVSKAKVSRATDRAVDQAVNKQISKTDHNRAGLSIRNGPVPMDIDSPAVNGGFKRKARSSISSKFNYKDESDSDEPMVCQRIMNN